MGRPISEAEQAVAQAALLKWAAERPTPDEHQGKMVTVKGYRRLVVYIDGETVVTVGARAGERRIHEGAEAVEALKQLGLYVEPPKKTPAEQSAEVEAIKTDLKAQADALRSAIKRYNEQAAALFKVVEERAEKYNATLDKIETLMLQTANDQWFGDLFEMFSGTDNGPFEEIETDVLDSNDDNLDDLDLTPEPDELEDDED